MTSLTAIVAVPAASSAPTPTRVAVFNFVQAIILIVAFTKVKVEVVTVDPLTTATVTDAASVAGAA